MHEMSMREIHAHVASYHETIAVLLDAPAGVDAYPVFAGWLTAGPRWTSRH
jgi:hypothetical protein